jgi:hypothetical protein
MKWLRDLHQTLSRKLGYRHGVRGLPYRRPLWAASMAYGPAYLDGRQAYLERQSLGRGSSNGD